MAAKKTNPAMDFILDSLKSDRGAQYSDIAAAAAKKRLKIYPIMFGRAQALLGIVKSAPRGQGKAARAKQAPKAPKAPKGRGPGRPRKAAAPSGFEGSLEGIVMAVKSSEQAKTRYRSALEKIQSILAAALE
ncbi:MAG: hypothetical protein KF830_05315 [Planctomycetes bacterium]|nr:hypothetical protein [Planctomycetota bacterium]